jgi:rhomboid protease GluP
MQPFYFVSGLAGDMMSMWFELYSGERYSSIGASGAIFGIIGSLLFIVIACGGRTDNVTVGRIAFITAFSLYTGFTSQGSEQCGARRRSYWRGLL